MTRDNGSPNRNISSRGFGGSGLGPRPKPADRIEFGFGGSGLGGRPAPTSSQPRPGFNPKTPKPKTKPK